MKKIIKITISVFFIFILVVFYLSLNRSSNYDTENLVGIKLSKIKLESFESNKYFTNENLKKNNYTLINFWASWCAPCRAEHKYLIKIKKNTQNLKILGINFKDKENEAKFFLSEFGNPYHFSAQDSDGKMSVNFGIYGIPESILVDEKLRIMKKFIGPINSQDYKTILQLTE